MSKSLSAAFQDCCTRFAATADTERTLAARQSTVTVDLGLARSVHVRLAAVHRDGCQQMDGDTPEQLERSLETFNRIKNELRQQQDRVEALASVRNRILEQQRQAAEDNRREYAHFLKGAHDEFHSLWGKTSERFRFWGSQNQEEFEWRRVIFAHLVNLCSQGTDDCIGLLKTFLRGDSFGLCVSRGFFLKNADGVMVNIPPAMADVSIDVPSRIPFRDAFEQIINGRAAIGN